MFDYEKMDVNPLIDDLEKEFLCLDEQHKIFMSISETVGKTTLRFHNFQDKYTIQNM
jgi:hypothetical protein